MHSLSVVRIEASHLSEATLLSAIFIGCLKIYLALVEALGKELVFCDETIMKSLSNGYMLVEPSRQQLRSVIEVILGLIVGQNGLWRSGTMS